MSTAIQELYDNPKYNLGNCLVRVSNNDELYGYVNIPKNASCLTKIFWDGAVPLNFKEDDTSEIKEFVVVLRNPMRRWISGVAQALDGEDCPDNQIWETAQQIVLDNHTIPQVKYIEGLDLSRVVWMCAENDLQTALIKYTADKFGVIKHNFEQTRRNGGLNVTADTPNKQRIVDYLRTLLAMRSAYKKLVLDFYKDDFDLYNSVKFINQ